MYTSSAGFIPLPCCFWLKLLDVYEIGIAPNFKFEFCSYTSLLLRDVTFRTIIAKFAENVQDELRKIDTQTYSCVWTVGGSAKTVRTTENVERAANE